MVRMETALHEDHGPVSEVGNVDFAFESGVDGVDLTFSKAEALKVFSRRDNQQERTSAPFTAQDLLEALAAKKISRTNLLSHIELNPVNNELSLEADRTNIRARFGYDVGKKPYVYPEEALYLLDTGKSEIFCNHLSLSVQRARSLLLVPQNTKEKSKSGMDKYCTHDEYLVYKALTRMGYCLYRYKPEVPPNHGNASYEISENVDVDSVHMEDDDIIIEGEQEAGNQIEDENIVELKEVPGGASPNHRKAFKRKFEDSPSDESSDEMMEDFPAMQMQAQPSYLFNTAYEETFQDEPSGYTVDEADSDVEIVDEVIFSHGGVEIQEIGHSVGCQEESMGMSDEPVPSTSRGPAPLEVVVDLVSSEDEDEDSKMFGRKVWSKFIPNSKVFFQKPPSKLIPQSIPSSDNVYEFDLKDKSDISDLELEFLVDEVSLNDDKYEWFPDSSETCNFTAVKSWKDWRQNIFQEARNVMNNSLLASSEYINGEAATEKLFLWQEFHEESGPPGLILSKIVFVMYGPAVQGYSRQKALEGKPLYYVIISRQDDSIPDFGMFGSSINGVPVLIAVVCDSGEGEVVFMTTDRNPLNSLF